MARIIGVFAGLLTLAACGGDGLGSNYSSARAQSSPVQYIPVTPGAAPITTASVQTVNAPTSAGVLTEPVAVTPGAVPIYADGQQTVRVQNGTALAPTASLKPVSAPGRSTRSTSVAPAKPVSRNTGPRYARGDIYAACRNAGRQEASDRRCGCVQWVADQRLTSAQQKRGAGYFTDQQGLQDTRQSDNAANERFWQAWKAFGQVAGQQCRKT